jgi:hypothetical protein
MHSHLGPPRLYDAVIDPVAVRLGWCRSDRSHGDKYILAIGSIAILFKGNDAACKFIAKLQSENDAKIRSTIQIHSEKLIGLLQSRSFQCWRQYTAVYLNLLTHYRRYSMKRDRQIMRMAYEYFKLNLAKSQIQHLRSNFVEFGDMPKSIQTDNANDI